MDFIDIEGASGARYRFRAWPHGVPQLPGNYAYVRTDADRVSVLAVGEAIDLSQVRSDWPQAATQGATQVFTRLNVPKTIRHAEHEDLAARYGAIDAGKQAAASKPRRGRN